MEYPASVFATYSLYLWHYERLYLFYGKAEREEQFIITKFLIGLNESYANTRSQILLMNPLPSLNKKFHLVCLE